MFAQLVPGSHFDSDTELRRYETLLQMADLVVRHSDLQQLFRDQPVRGVVKWQATQEVRLGVRHFLSGRRLVAPAA